ncbi:hypothetical protein QA640_47170 (plasmid) [Bradyrhizobium sp. CB82]|uniref:hypothetical protein n=1 Tax=Bradyrhizobium sp. CB82 TaxID=3039159 RepID=UPI0024B1F0C2|nr:hypothetical protein [Bradyrhizobium sp. CB82]WFU45585.1 hypothetical protein QA640_47170 [Bradyrhizobium sp. CB82]
MSWRQSKQVTTSSQPFSRQVADQLGERPDPRKIINTTRIVVVPTRQLGSLAPNLGNFGISDDRHRRQQSPSCVAWMWQFVAEQRNCSPNTSHSRSRRYRSGSAVTFDEIETRAVAAIRSADHFTASIFLGRGQYRIKKRSTVLAAMQAARELENDPAAFTRRAIIYAIAPDGHATLLTAALIAKLLSLLKTKV